MSPRDSGAFLETARWFQARVVAPHEARKKLPQLAPAEKYILPSRTLPPEKRVGIYVEAYLARLIEVLKEDFPAVARLIGHRMFHKVCRDFLERHPSKSKSLNPLGEKMADFLGGPVNIPRREAARDLARLERAMSEVFDAEETQSLQPEDFPKSAPLARLPLRLKFVPTFRLLVIDHDVNPFIDAVRQERKLPPLLRRRSWVAVYRKNFRVWRVDLDEAAYAALERIGRGLSVGSAVRAAAGVWSGSGEDLAARLREWFGGWSRAGFFVKQDL